MSMSEELHEALVHIAELEARQAVLVEALGKTASHIEAMMAHIEHKPQRFKEHCWSQVVAARAALAAVKGDSDDKN